MPADRLDHVRWVWPAYVTTVSFGVMLRGAISDRVFEVELCDYDGWLGGRLGYFSDPWIVAVIYNRHHHRSHHRGSFKPCESHGRTQSVAVTSLQARRERRRQFISHPPWESNPKTSSSSDMTNDNAHDQGMSTSYKRSTRGVDNLCCF